MRARDLSRIRAVVGRHGGQVGGQATTNAKQKAARRNGKMGGRPRIYPTCPRYSAHRFTDDRCPCGYVR